MSAQVSSKAVPVNVLEKLQKLFVSNRFVSSYIFVGPDRDHKISAAKLMAKHLNCLDDNGSICGSCKNCRMIDEDKYFGFITLNVGEEKAKSSIKIDDIRQVKRDVSYGAYTGWQIVFIGDAHKLTSSASNSLLKTLEESPNHVIFILDIPNQYFLLPTIRSRSQIILFSNSQNINIDRILFSDISVDKFFNFVENNNITELILKIDRSKVDRIESQESLEELIEWFFSKYRQEKNDNYLTILNIVRKYRKYLDRPVNATTNLLLMILEIKDYI